MKTFSQTSMQTNAVFQIILPTWNILHDAFIMDVFLSLSFKKKQWQKIKMTFAQGKKTVQTIKKKLVSTDQLCLPVPASLLR